ncbi:hypothetical protein FXO37_22181 [Capsicum annuum]|nr:hypothetical protein FXO37_22181 [Capsicum annuum]
MGQKKKSGSSKRHGNVANTKAPKMQIRKVQSDANQNSRADEEWRRGASWTEMKHRWASCTLLEDGNNHLNLCLQW